MTESTWKDPLLAKWWEGCSEETRALYAPVPSASATDLLLGFAETKQTFGLPDCAYHDARRLRSLIDAELARVRELEGELAEVRRC